MALTPVRNPLASPLLASLLRDGFEVQLEVTGSSMYPRIRSGDLVRVQPIAGIRSAKGLSPGQIILFNNRAGDLCLHRVVAVSRGRVETQGDSVSERDGSVRIQPYWGWQSPFVLSVVCGNDSTNAPRRCVPVTLLPPVEAGGYSGICG